MIRLIGHIWNPSLDLKIGEFPIISINLELESWENNDCLTEYLLKKFPHFVTHQKIYLSVDDIKDIIQDLSLRPQTIYGEDGKLRALKDYSSFKIALNWLSENFPFASVSYEYLEK